PAIDRPVEVAGRPAAVAFLMLREPPPPTDGRSRLPGAQPGEPQEPQGTVLGRSPSPIRRLRVRQKGPRAANGIAQSGNVICFDTGPLSLGGGARVRARPQPPGPGTHTHPRACLQTRSPGACPLVPRAS